MMEAVYLGLRQTDGILIEAFNRNFEVDFSRMLKDTVDGLAVDGLMKKDSESCSLTQKGMLLMDTIVGQLISLI